MEKETRLVEADTQITLQIEEQTFRISCADPTAIMLLTDVLGDLVVQGDAFLGFKIVPPNSAKGIFRLMSGDGSVLARTPSLSNVIATLLGHLAGLASPLPPAGWMRLSLRAVVGPRASALIDPSLLATRPLVERRLERFGGSILDLPFVDLHTETMELGSVQVSWLEGEQVGPGHIQPTDLSSQAALFLTSNGGNVPATRAWACYKLASAARIGTPAGILDDSIRVLGSLEAAYGDRNDAASLYEAIHLAVT